jgi:hypothetical protein
MHTRVDRSKGVFIETVEERAAKAEARKNKKFDGSAGIYDIKPSDLQTDPPTLGFKYVRVPCDDSAPFEQMDGLGYDACDNFLTMLRPKFAGGTVDADKAQRAAVQHLGASVPTLGEKGLSTLTDAGLSLRSSPPPSSHPCTRLIFPHPLSALPRSYPLHTGLPLHLSVLLESAEDGQVEAFALVRPAGDACLPNPSTPSPHFSRLRLHDQPAHGCSHVERALWCGLEMDFKTLSAASWWQLARTRTHTHKQSHSLVVAASNKHCGVYIYLDEVGMLKGLPPNRRASGIAKTCGFDDAQFFGGVSVCSTNTMCFRTRSKKQVRARVNTGEGGTCLESTGRARISRRLMLFARAHVRSEQTCSSGAYRWSRRRCTMSTFLSTISTLARGGCVPQPRKTMTTSWACVRSVC